MSIEDEIKAEIRRMEKKAGCKAETWSIDHFPTFYTWYKAFCWVQSRLRGEGAMWKPTYITTNFPPSHKFHDDQFSDREVVVKDFPYMRIFGDFRLFNGLTIKEFDDFLARLVPSFCELEKMHVEKKMGG